MFLLLLAALGLVMLRPLMPEAEPPTPPLQLNIAHLAIGGVQGLEWRRQRLIVVHPGQGNYRVFADYDPLYGCPLEWIPSGAEGAPLATWPGGLRAICTPHWFDMSGKAVTEGVADLKQLPSSLAAPDTLQITAP